MTLLIILIYLLGTLFVCYKLFSNAVRAHDYTDFMAVCLVFITWWFILIVMIADAITLVFLKDWDDSETSQELIIRKWQERKIRKGIKY